MNIAGDKSSAPTRPPTTKPGDAIHLPGGQPARVVDSGVTEHVIPGKDDKRIVRNGFLIVEVSR